MTQHSTPEGNALRVLVDDWFVQARFGHWDSCPAHPDRVRGHGPCDPEKCGYDRKYEEFIAALAARGAPEGDAYKRGQALGSLIADGINARGAPVEDVIAMRDESWTDGYQAAMDETRRYVAQALGWDKAAPWESVLTQIRLGQSAISKTERWREIEQEYADAAEAQWEGEMRRLREALQEIVDLHAPGMAPALPRAMRKIASEALATPSSELQEEERGEESEA